MFSCQYCTKSFYLDIKKKIIVPKKLHLLVITLNMKDYYNEAKVCGILTKLIRKLTDFFFMIFGEKVSTNIP